MIGRRSSKGEAGLNPNVSRKSPWLPIFQGKSSSRVYAPELTAWWLCIPLNFGSGLGVASLQKCARVRQRFG